MTYRTPVHICSNQRATDDSWHYFASCIVLASVMSKASSSTPRSQLATPTRNTHLATFNSTTPFLPRHFRIILIIVFRFSQYFAGESNYLVLIVLTCVTRQSTVSTIVSKSDELPLHSNLSFAPLKRPGQTWK